MPYITKQRREELAVRVGKLSCSPGELNYILTTIVNAYIKTSGGPSYMAFNDAIGALECAKLELYRRVVAPYEDIKKQENGDVYS